MEQERASEAFICREEKDIWGGYEVNNKNATFGIPDRNDGDSDSNLDLSAYKLASRSV